MGRAYSEDLRHRLVAAVESGKSCREVAKIYQVSASCVIRLMGRWRAHGSVAASPVRGHAPRALGSEQEGWLREWVAGKPDITLAELQGKLRGRSVELTLVGIWKYLRRLGLSYKKSDARCRTGQAGRGSRKGRVEG